MSEAVEETSIQNENEASEDEEVTEESHTNKVLIDDPLARLEEAKAETIKRKSRDLEVTDFNVRWGNMYEEFLKFPPGTWRPSNFYGFIRENGTVVGNLDLNEDFFTPQRSECAFEYLPMRMAKKIMEKEEEKRIDVSQKKSESPKSPLKTSQGSDKDKEKDWRSYDEIGRLIITPSPKLVEFLAQEDKKGLDEEIKKVLKAKHKLSKQQKTIQDTKKNKVPIMDLLPKKKQKGKRRECKLKESKLKDTESKDMENGEVKNGTEESDTKIIEDSDTKIIVESDTKVLKAPPEDKSKPSKKKSKKLKDAAADKHKEKRQAHRKAQKAHISGRVPKEPCYPGPDGIKRKKRIPLRIGMFRQVNFCRKTLSKKNVDWVDSTLTAFYGQKKYRDEPPPITHILTENEKSLRFAELRRRPVGIDYNYTELREARRAFLSPKKSPWPCKVDEETKYGGHNLRSTPPWNCCKPKPKSKHCCYCRRDPWIGWSFPGCCQVWPRTPFGFRKPKKPKKIDKRKWGWWIEKEGAPPIPDDETVYFIIRRKTTHMYFIIKESSTVNDLKRMIEGVVYVAPLDQRLYYSMTRLHGSQQLAEAGFNNSKHGRTNPAVIFLRIKKKGKWETMAIAKLSNPCPIPPGMEEKKEEIKRRIHNLFNSQYIPWEMFMPRKIRRLLTNPVHENDFKQGTAPKVTSKANQEDPSEMDVSASFQPGAEEISEQKTDTTTKAKENDKIVPRTVETSNAEGVEAENADQEDGSKTQLKKSSSHFLDFID